MNEHRGTLDRPVHLLDPFAGDIDPAPREGCARCVAEGERRTGARAAGLVFVAVEASHEIRRHPRHWPAMSGNPQDDSDSGNKHGGGGSDEGGNTNDGQGPAEGR
ncbi:hypothetical protein [Streptomyces monomycini]|uniref:hypothetical protein n=1 Tax=Streptomyces monomycini TaxID=371720 RepID=UPI000517C9B1|nr:hypothetical protein [Streptomyces monomycini]